MEDELSLVEQNCLRPWMALHSHLLLWEGTGEGGEGGAVGNLCVKFGPQGLRADILHAHS
jgi:hypothetical protein